MREYIDIQGTITSYIYSLWKHLRQRQNQFHRGKKRQLRMTKPKK
jgi:hypothetical protein